MNAETVIVNPDRFADMILANDGRALSAPKPIKFPARRRRSDREMPFELPKAAINWAALEHNLTIRRHMKLLYQLVCR